MKLQAHLTKNKGVRVEQSLKEHCLNTAKYATESMEHTILFHTVYLAGLLHDMGKATVIFNKYLEEAYQGKKVERGSVNHTFAGVIYLFERFHTDKSSKWEKLTCEIISYASGAHHGLFDCVDLNGNNGFAHRLQKNKEELCYEEAVRNFFPQIVEENLIEKYFLEAVKEVEKFFSIAKSTYANSGKQVFFQISMLTRLVLSAVIYGDRRDTSEFMGQRSNAKEEKLTWTMRRNYFENKFLKLDATSPLNQVRKDISQQCLNFAGKPEGIYRIKLATGGGKTLCTLRYALAHAEKHNKKRIIFIIPLLSVLDQNAKEIRKYVPDKDEVLEHHSNVVHEKHGEEEADPYEFLTEDWNAPIIVSTLVQLLDILFKHQPSAIRRMQALCDSVIVIDEVQSVPKKMTAMFNMALNFLKQYCKATIILSSATQPCFDEVKWPLHMAEEPDMVRLNQSQLQVFKRAEIVDGLNHYGMDWDECVGFCSKRMEQHVSLLVVCNTKAEARILFEKLEAKAQEWDIVHLSTAMCQAHRLDKLEELKEKLTLLQKSFGNGGKARKLICVSTQLIEAGVDFSFEGVVRVLAGVDNLVQAAGRCNRSNEYGDSGKVYLINLKNENLSMLHESVNAQISTRKVLAYMKQVGEESLISEPAIHKFYQYLFEEMGHELKYPIKDYGTTIYLTDLLSNDNGSGGNKAGASSILHQPFKTIGKEFKVFDQETIDVLVPYKEGKQLMEQLQRMDQSFVKVNDVKNIMQQARRYTVNIYEWQREKLMKAGLLCSILEGRVFILDEKSYNSSSGFIDIDE